MKATGAPVHLRRKLKAQRCAGLILAESQVEKQSPPEQMLMSSNIKLFSLTINCTPQVVQHRQNYIQIHFFLKPEQKILEKTQNPQLFLSTVVWTVLRRMQTSQHLTSWFVSSCCCSDRFHRGSYIPVNKHLLWNDARVKKHKWQEGRN